MLTQIKLSNFKSFKEPTVIDFNATKYSMLKESNTKDNVLKGSLFIGANASGKTNAIYSISVLLDLLFSNSIVDMTSNFCLFSMMIKSYMI